MYRKDEGLWGNGKPYSIELTLLFLIVCFVGGTIAAESIGITTIHAQVKAKVVVSAPDDALSWDINPKSVGIYTKTQVINVKANTDWQLTVRDADFASGGYMREWTGDRYGSETLLNPMRVAADEEVILPNPRNMPIKEGKITGGQGVDVQVTFMQEVTAKDKPLPGDNVYRKVVTFVGSPKE
jgi:hypothetical protein